VPRNDLYSTYANLGTFLILGPFRQIRPGNEEDKQILREGLKHIQTAIEINPDSHFGREIWQAVIIEYMIALYDNPKLLLQFDMVGNRLDRLPSDDRHPIRGKGGPDSQNRWGPRYGGVAFARRAGRCLKQPESWTDDLTTQVRQGITAVGADEGWDFAVRSSHGKRVPFDEPTLGIVGMWRLGGGAHPYFAVALGE